MPSRRGDRNSDQPSLFREKFWSDHDLLRDQCTVPGGPLGKLLLLLLLSRMGPGRTSWEADLDELAGACQCAATTLNRKIRALRRASLLGDERLPNGRVKFLVCRANLADFTHDQIGRPRPNRSSDSDQIGRDSRPNRSEPTTDLVGARIKQQQDLQQDSNSARAQPTDAVIVSPDAAAMRRVVEAWNQLPFRQCRELNAKRTQSLKARLSDPEWAAHWAEALARIGDSTFCGGEGRQGWIATFDWFVRADTITKILEGTYDNPAHQRDTRFGPGQVYMPGSEPDGGSAF